ncbi:MAG TPA: BatD family protein, partial [Bacteroidales bacterium]|nr:BatD family protein [Bacteroidales bacterium]
MRKILLTTGLLIICMSLMAQEIAISVDAPPTAVAGEGFRIVYSVNSTDGRFEPPAFDRSFTVNGPQTSTSRNVQWIDGEVSTVATTTLIYYVVASETGKFTFPAAQYITKKLTVASAPVVIEVVSDGAAAAGGLGATGSAATNAGQAQAGQSSARGAEVSLRLIMSDNTVYVGQPVTVTLKLYTRINLSGINDLKYPDFKGFLREDIETPPLKSLQQENIGGVVYGTGVLQKFMLFPQVPGEIKIDPVQITAMIQQRASGGDPFFNDPFFDSFFSTVTTVPRTVSSGPVTLYVNTLPSPQPSDFYGAVGSFGVTSLLNRTEIEVNDALTYTVTLKGSGNLSLAGAPIISFPQGIEKYDPKVSIKSTGAGAGSKTYEYLLIPRNTGTFDIPPLSYTVFDLSQQKYVTYRTDGYRINVTGSTGAGAAADAPAFIPGD